MSSHEFAVAKGMLMALHHIWVPLVDAALDFDDYPQPALLQNRNFFLECIPTFELEQWGDLIEAFASFSTSILEAARILRERRRLLGMVEYLRVQSADFFHTIDSFWRMQPSQQIENFYNDIPPVRVCQPPVYGQIEDQPPCYFSIFDSDGSELPPELQANRRGLRVVEEPVVVPLVDSTPLFERLPASGAGQDTDGVWEDIFQPEREPITWQWLDEDMPEFTGSEISFEDLDDREVGAWLVEEGDLPQGQALETGTPILSYEQSMGLHNSVCQAVTDTCCLCWLNINHRCMFPTPRGEPFEDWEAHTLFSFCTNSVHGFLEVRAFLVYLHLIHQDILTHPQREFMRVYALATSLDSYSNFWVGRHRTSFNYAMSARSPSPADDLEDMDQ